LFKYLHETIAGVEGSDFLLVAKIVNGRVRYEAVIKIPVVVASQMTDVVLGKETLYEFDQLVQRIWQIDFQAFLVAMRDCGHSNHPFQE
jgi:hypothetical protein